VIDRGSQHLSQVVPERPKGGKVGRIELNGASREPRPNPASRFPRGTEGVLAPTTRTGDRVREVYGERSGT
jgi:hypothetical protein